MRHSHNTTYTVEVRFSSRQASEVHSILGLSAVVCSGELLRQRLNFIKLANQSASFLPFFLRSIAKAKALLESALTNRAWMAQKATTGNGKMMLKPVGTIANANLIASQSYREVTKPNVLETPYPEMPPVWSIQKDRAVVAKTNSQTPTSTRMRHTAS